MLKKGLKDLLIADSNIAAIVGNRVRVGRLPQDSDFTTVVFRFVASEFATGVGGVNATQLRRVQVDCWGKTPKDADELAQAVHNLLDGYRGVLSEGTTVQASLPSGDVDLLDEDLKIAGIAVDFNIRYVPSNFVVGSDGFTFPERDLDITDEDRD